MVYFCALKSYKKIEFFVVYENNLRNTWKIRYLSTKKLRYNFINHDIYRVNIAKKYTLFRKRLYFSIFFENRARNVEFYLNKYQFLCIQTQKWSW